MKMVDLKNGDVAPSFLLPSTNGNDVSLDLYLGKNIVLYFYPKDDTPGCTKEAKEFNELYDDFLKEDTHILGISADGINSHINFKEKYEIKFDFLSDWQHDVVNKYGVWIEKSMFGKKYMGIERSTFIIGKKGKIESIFRKIKPAGHALKMLKEIEILNNQAT